MIKHAPMMMLIALMGVLSQGVSSGVMHALGIMSIIGFIWYLK